MRWLQTAARAILAGVLVLWGAGSAHALLFSDISTWAGSGSNQAGMVIQWRAPEVRNLAYSDEETPMPNPIEDVSLAWGYRFDGTKTGADMMMALAGLDPRLYVLASGSTAYGAAIFGIGYDYDGDGLYGLSDGTSTYTQDDFIDGWLGGLGYDAGDYFTPTDDGDLYWGGWYGANWELWEEQGGNGGFTTAAPDRGTDPYWTGDEWGFAGSHGQWDFAQVGVSSMDLEDGSWVGWSVAAGGLDYGAWPLPEGTVAWMQHKQAPDTNWQAVPEPGTSCLFLLSAVPVLLWRRRAQRSLQAATGEGI